MSLAEFAVTRERETHVAALLVRYWPELRDKTFLQRHVYTVGALVADPPGLVQRDRFRAALQDPEVCARATLLIAVVRYTKNDGGEYTP